MVSNENFDAIWFGGGAAGRFGAAFMKALGGRALLKKRVLVASAT